MSKPQLPEKIWPAHLKPKPEELLSSWLVRLAMAHGQKLHTFCTLAFPGKAIWNRDLDKSADAEIVETLASKTVTPIEDARATTLATFEGILYEKHNHYGPNPWIMPVGVYHRKREKFGLQYCSRCLAEDEEPYFRRTWRLAFVVICEKHHTQLKDRCPDCGAAINFHRDELGKFTKYAPSTMTLCHICAYDLTDITSEIYSPPSLVKPAEVNFIIKLQKALTDGFITVSDNALTYSHLFFTTLRQLLKILGMRDKRIAKLRYDISQTYHIQIDALGSEAKRLDVQEQDVIQRKQLLDLARCLLEEWPHRFIALSQKHTLWSSIWLRHLESGSGKRSQAAPFWFWEVVHEHLNRMRYCPSDEEVIVAHNYLKRIRAPLNKSSLSRLLGVAAIRRPDSLYKTTTNIDSST